ncbi:hypothetical protein B566_EDAN012197 [Ephemera danica]|nr:hypothetical protein B566_EDAN012197 [Ephemera danica]
MDDESRVKEASAILHSMMTKSNRMNAPQAEKMVKHIGDRDHPDNPQNCDDMRQNKYAVLTNVREPPPQQMSHLMQMNCNIPDRSRERDSSPQQIYVTPEIQDVMSESEEPKIDKKPVMPRKKRKIADYLASGIDPTKLEESVAEVLHRFSLGCECIESNCFTNLNADLVYRHRLNIAELTKAEQDMYLMGVTMASLTNPDETCRRKERQRLRAQYVFQGKKVCLDAFLYLENCTHYQLKRIRKHVMTHGVTPRVHGNHGKSPHNTFSLDIYKHAISFLENFIEPYTPAMVTNKPSKTKSKKVVINLPPKITRKNIHNLYKEFCLSMDPPIKVMGYSSFRHFISEQFPHVRFSKPEKAGAPSKLPTDMDKPHDESQFDSDNQETTEPPGTTIPLVMTSTQPDPNPTTFSSGGNTYVITQVLPAGFVPVSLNNPGFQGMTLSDQSTNSNVVMAPPSSMASQSQSGTTSYSFA